MCVCVCICVCMYVYIYSNDLSVYACLIQSQLTTIVNYVQPCHICLTTVFLLTLSKALIQPWQKKLFFNTYLHKIHTETAANCISTMEIVPTDLPVVGLSFLQTCRIKAETRESRLPMVSTKKKCSSSGSEAIASSSVIFTEFVIPTTKMVTPFLLRSSASGIVNSSSFVDIPSAKKYYQC